MSISQHIPVTLLAVDRTASLKAVLKDSAGTVISNYVDAAFSALETNGRTRVLAYEISSAAFVGKLTIWLADGSKEIGTIYIEPDYQMSAGSGGVIVTPLSAAIDSADVITSTLKIRVYEGETHTVSILITDPNGDPIDLSAKSLRFVVRDSDYNGLFQITSGASMTVTGTGNNQVNITITEPNTDHRDYVGKWELWNDTDNGLLLMGDFVIDGTKKQIT